MTNIDYESELKKAELHRIQAETARINSEREKIDHEKAELVLQRNQKWWNIRASGLIQSVIGGIVAGALVAGFGLDYFLKISQLNEKGQQALIAEKEEIQSEKRQAEEESRQEILSLQNENNQLKAKVEKAEEALNEIEISVLSSNSSDRSEERLNSEIASLKSEFQRLRSEAVSREERLSTDLKNLIQEHEASVKEAEGTWFPVIASPYNDVDLQGKLEELGDFSVKYPIHVYKSADKRGVPVYAITLGGYLSKAEASKRVYYARSSGIASDAYAWSSNIWGSNIRQQFP